MAKAERPPRIDISKHLGLVYPVARRYADKRVAFEDLVQEGCLGLHRAAEKFDPSKGYAFSTYAQWWVRAFIQKAWQSLRCVVHYAPQITIRPAEASLDKIVTSDGESLDTFRDLLPDGQPLQEARYGSAEERELVQRAINVLNARERRIIRMRFESDATLQQCGDVYGVSRERARQLEVRALQKLGTRLKKTLKRAV